MRAQGGKEEIRASWLRPCLLRIRGEKGEAMLRRVLSDAAIEGDLESDGTWLSVATTGKALVAIARALGGVDALKTRGEWVTHSDVLGALVRMLRTAKSPEDAYRFLMENTRETNRVGSWNLEDATFGIKLTYAWSTDADDPPPSLSKAEQELFCACRIGELASYPRIWGLPDATISHDTCIAKGGKECVYSVTVVSPVERGIPPVALGAVGGIVGGVSVYAVGDVVSGAVAGVVSAALSFFAATQMKKNRADRSQRVFEKNRIVALERGLELKGDLPSEVPGDIAGTILGGKYRIGRKIGSGGIGAVYAAEHVSLGNEVAIKVLRGAAAKDASEIARLRREAQIQTHIEHPNVARVLDMDQMPDGSIFVVMERLHGRSLADKLQREGVLAPGFAIPAFIDVCKGLGAAHERGVVHRDLKPGNVFLCSDGSAKILDFGMSKLTSAEALTQQGYTLGTPEYMAPEQCIGAAVEARTDMYAFGVLMYEALTGELPIRSSNRRELLDLHQREIPETMRERRPDLPIPEALDVLVMKCLEKKIAERPRSALEFERALSAISLEDLPISYPPGIGRRRKTAPKLVNGDKETMGRLP